MGGVKLTLSDRVDFESLRAELLVAVKAGGWVAVATESGHYDLLISPGVLVYVHEQQMGRAYFSS